MLIVGLIGIALVALLFFAHKVNAQGGAPPKGGGAGAAGKLAPKAGDKVDPKADPKRTEAAPGDVRLVMALVNDQPVAMLYRPRVPGATSAPGAPSTPGTSAGGRTFTSPVGQERVDEVRDITAEIQLRIVRQGGENTANGSWTLEAAVPWKTLGARDLRESLVLRGDVGALVADPHGTATAMRYYWANKSHVVLSDLPSEARLLPALWGELRFAIPDLIDRVPSARSAPGDDDPLKALK